MKTLYIIIILSLLSWHTAADALSLNDAVNQIKTEGRVLSARTIDGKHEIKVLTPSGTVKTVSMEANNAPINVKPQQPNYYNNGKPKRERKKNTLTPNRFNNEQKVIHLDSKQLDMATARKRSVPEKKKKDK